MLPALLKEAAACFPANLAGLRDWQPPWETAAPPPLAVSRSEPTAISLSEEEAAVQSLLREQPATTEALARLLGAEPVWPEAATRNTLNPATVGGEEATVQTLLTEHPETSKALAALIQRGRL